MKKQKQKKILYITITVLIILTVILLFSLLKNNRNVSNSADQELKTQRISNNIFEIELPIGWKMETVGSYDSFGFRAINPDNEAYQIFLYLKMSPFNKSTLAKEYFDNYLEDTSDSDKIIYEIRAKSPILEKISAEEFFSKFDEYTTLAKEYGSKHNYNKFNNLKISNINGYSSGLEFKTTAEELVKIDFTNNSNTLATGLFAVSIDATKENIIGYTDTAVIVARNIIGMSAPNSEFEKLQPILAKSLASFRFKEEYLTKINEKSNTAGENTFRTETLSRSIESINAVWSKYLSK